MGTVIKLQADLGDYSVNFKDLVAHAINSPTASKEKLTDPAISGAFWRDYFSKTDNPQTKD